MPDLNPSEVVSLASQYTKPVIADSATQAFLGNVPDTNNLAASVYNLLKVLGAASHQSSTDNNVRNTYPLSTQRYLQSDKRFTTTGSIRVKTAAIDIPVAHYLGAVIEDSPASSYTLVNDYEAKLTSKGSLLNPTAKAIVTDLLYKEYSNGNGGTGKVADFASKFIYLWSPYSDFLGVEVPLLGNNFTHHDRYGLFTTDYDVQQGMAFSQGRHFDTNVVVPPSSQDNNAFGMWLRTTPPTGGLNKVYQGVIDGSLGVLSYLLTNGRFASRNNSSVHNVGPLEPTTGLLFSNRQSSTEFELYTNLVSTTIVKETNGTPTSTEVVGTLKVNGNTGTSGETPTGEYVGMFFRCSEALTIEEINVFYNAMSAAESARPLIPSYPALVPTTLLQLLSSHTLVAAFAGQSNILGSTVNHSIKRTYQDEVDEYSQVGILSSVESAQGGTAFLRGRGDWTPADTLAQDLIAQINSAKATADGDTYFTPIHWWQGEGDSGTPENAARYKEQFLKLKETVENQTGMRLPWLMYRVHPGIDIATYPARLITINAQTEIINENDDVHLVDISDLPLTDGVHHSSTSYIEAGRRARAVINENRLLRRLSDVAFTPTIPTASGEVFNWSAGSEPAGTNVIDIVPSTGTGFSHVAGDLVVNGAQTAIVATGSEPAPNHKWLIESVPTPTGRIIRIDAGFVSTIAVDAFAGITFRANQEEHVSLMVRGKSLISTRCTSSFSLIISV